MLEFLYKKISSKQRAKTNAYEKETAAFFTDFKDALFFFVRAIYPTCSVILGEGHFLGYISKNKIMLPQKVCLFKNRELNRLVFLHKALVAGVICKHKIHYEDNQKQSYGQRSLQIWKAREKIQSYLRAEYPRYDEFFFKIFSNLNNQIYSKAYSDSDALFEKWIFHWPHHSTNTQQLKIKNWPLVTLAPWCELLSSEKQKHEALSSLDQVQKNKKITTELDHFMHCEIENINLEKKKKQDNPVMHSFEKLETLDEYSGGYRITDGGDDLTKHSLALNEVNLKKVTRDGEASQSGLKSSLVTGVEIADTHENKDEASDSILYPEWNYKSQSLKEDHCRLYIHQKLKAGQLQNHQKWLHELELKYEQNILYWRHKLDGLLNQKRWQDRQWEGRDINIDQYVRFYGDMRSGQVQEVPLYEKLLKSHRELSVLILFDQSLSTDSWVQNRRVLDVELEAIALIGKLVEPACDQFSVAGCWSQTRNQCHFRFYKQFQDLWESFYRQVPAISPQGYTRLGPAIRHGKEVLARSTSPKKLLLLLTDGKPTDYDRYEGQYGIEDIHHSALELDKDNIRLYALAVESQAKSYFPHLFGRNNYQILQDPCDLPEKLWQIYLEALRG